MKQKPEMMKMMKGMDDMDMPAGNSTVYTCPMHSEVVGY